MGPPELRAAAIGTAWRRRWRAGSEPATALTWLLSRAVDEGVSTSGDCCVVGLWLPEHANQRGRVAGELGHDAQLRPEREDREACAGLDRAQVVDHLAAHAHLVAERRVERVEQQHVDGARLGIRGQIGVGVRRQRRGRQKCGRSAGGLVLVKREDGLLVAVFEDMKAAPVEAMHGFVVVGDDNVDQNKAGVGCASQAPRSFGIARSATAGAAIQDRKNRARIGQDNAYRNCPPITATIYQGKGKCGPHPRRSGGLAQDDLFNVRLLHREADPDARVENGNVAVSDVSESMTWGTHFRVSARLR